MTLKRIFSLAIVLVILLSGFQVFSTIRLLATEKELVTAITYEKDALILANTMTQSSEDLTSYIRQYAMTGEASYRNSYFLTLEVADGKVPRADGTSISFQDMVKRMKLTPFEEENILKSQEYSMNLVNLETEVMNYIDAWIDGHPVLDLKDADDPELRAQQIRLFSREYMDEIDKIMDPVETFQTLLKQRVAEQVSTSKRTEQLMQLLFVISISVMILVVVFILFALSRYIGGNLSRQVVIIKKMAEGDISERLVIKSKDEFGIIATTINGMSETLSALIDETGMLTKAALEGRLETRGEAAKFTGGYHDIVQGFNNTLDVVVAKIFWYEQMLDSIPFPISVTDMDMNWTFFNGAAEKVTGKTRKEMCGEQCSNWGADICNSDRCGVKLLRKGTLSSYFKQPGMDMDFQVDTAYLLDASGVRIGHIEIVQDITKAQRISEYNKAEIERLAKNLLSLSIGNVDFDLAVAEADNYTEAENKNFTLINQNLGQVKAALGSLVEDAGMLAQAAVEGRLQTRADAAKHQGDFRKIVDGVNKTLDLVIDPVKETTAILKRMAEGDLTATMTGDYKGDFDILKTALNDTLNSINDILGQVASAIDQVSSGSQQVSQASQSLSQGATEQASSLEEITSSVTQIAGQTRQNTEGAVQVTGLAKTAKQDSEMGNTQMKDLVLAMSDVNKSAEEIRKIVKAIDDISFQINLLALNANVEAARAGKYGKGFAVVAEEVRNLAVRSAGSVKETTAMVDEAIANIGRGNRLVDLTAKQLAAITDGAGKVAGLAEEVAVASREQSQGLEQISTGLNQIDQVTQSNTASAEESASAAEELSSQSQQLKSMIARFKLKQAESKMTSAEMMAMMRAELARQGGAPQAATARARQPQALALHKDDAALASPGGKAAQAKAGAKLAGNPAQIISLDDEDFGKF